MSARLPFCLTAHEVDAPRGWAVMRIEEAHEQLPVGRRYDKRTVRDGGTVPVIDQSLRGTLGFHNGDPGVVASRDSPVATFANHTCAMRLMRSPFSVIQNVFPLVGRPGICETDFLYYATNGRQQTEEYKGHHPAWRQSYFALPAIEVQRRIADIFVGIDELIENNRRRIELLEQMAQAVYREWFVRFRYPGHEDVPLIDSPLGPIPEDWAVVHLTDLATIVRGRSYRKSELVDIGGMPFINLKCMLRGGGFRRDGIKRFVGKHNAAQEVRCGDIVLAVTDLTQGREILARATILPKLDDEPGVISLDVVRIVPREGIDNWSLGFALRCTDFSDRVKEFANGSTVLHLSPKHVAEGLLVWPSDRSRKTFALIAKRAVEQINALECSNQRLAGIRDLLLPRLVTGKIDVSRLDLEVLEGATA